MRGLYATILSLAILGQVAAGAPDGPNQRSYDQLAGPYNRFTQDHKQRIDAGWVPRTASIHPRHSVIRKDAPAGFLPERGTYEFGHRESLRRAYKGSFQLPAEEDPYLILTEGDLQTTRKDGSCALGDKCRHPKIIHDQGHCRRNICIMISAHWCGPCKEMYETVTDLRREGYIFYIFDITKDEFKNYDAKFDVDSLPTFIVLEDGKEVTRTVGLTDKEWFRDHLDTREEQDKPQDDSNIYDGI